MRIVALQLQMGCAGFAPQHLCEESATKLIKEVMLEYCAGTNLGNFKGKVVKAMCDGSWRKVLKAASVELLAYLICLRVKVQDFVDSAD
uniref:Uncharacterized protein n=1 Tax=Kalanchoe fedtschenkoi TaxID=63787 RepID=A0A7N0UBB6_KALFE